MARNDGCSVMKDLANLAYLAVDDDPGTQQILLMLLSRVIGSSHFAILENSEHFLEKVQGLPFVPSVVLLDIAVRPLDGYSMLALLRNQPGFTQAKIVALTARVMNKEIERMKLAGFDGLISKPIISPIFTELLTRIVQGDSVWYVT